VVYSLSIPADDSNAKLVRAIIQVGPGNFSLLSRLTGIPPETVRYKIKNQLVKKGINVHAIIDVNKFGLQRTIVQLKFTEKYHAISKPILQALHELSYLTYYSGELMTRQYYSHFQIPIQYKAEFTEFLDAMVNFGMLESYLIRPVSWINHISLRPEYFDIQSGRWDIDWQGLKLVEDIPKVLSPEFSTGGFDKPDLMITTKLTADALATIADMSRNLGINVKTLQYHYTRHLLERNMISKYVVRWMGDIESTRKHRIIFGRLYAHDLSKVELDLVRKAVYSLPFTWSETITDNRQLFVAEVFIPVEHLVYVQYFLNNNLGDLASRVELRTIDSSSSMAFTTPATLFDPITESWRYELSQNIARLEKLQEVYR
jgi:DNA-binding Lrp family transcriptional regulator